ncbi:MAG: DUF3426 domain-containing protein, partial [Comamonadaceae bacterium]
MSLVTRCPACTTTFKVVRDQLRISDGWVRCGRCSHVFDASLDLRELSDAEPAPTVVAAPPPEPKPEPEPDLEPEAERLAPAQEPVPTPEPAPPAPVSDDADFFDEVPATVEPPFQEPLPSALTTLPVRSLGPTQPVGLIADEPWPEPAESGFDDLPSAPAALTSTRSVADIAPSLELDLVGQVQLQKALRHARIESVKLARAQEKSAEAAAAALAVDAQEAAPVVQMASEPEAPPVPPTSVPSFLRVASSSAFWRGAKGRAILAGGIALASLLLLAQVLHRERDAIAASQPGLRPLLESVCSVTGCELAALRRINEITINGAAFAREKVGDGYR